MTQRSALIYDTMVQVYEKYPLVFILFIFMQAGLIFAAYYCFFRADSDKRHK